MVLNYPKPLKILFSKNAFNVQKIQFGFVLMIHGQSVPTNCIGAQMKEKTVKKVKLKSIAAAI